MAKTRLYTMFSLIFVVVGAVLFAYIYFVRYSGNITAVANPVELILIVVPFIPAGIMTFLSKRSEGKAVKLVAELNAKK